MVPYTCEWFSSSFLVLLLLELSSSILRNSLQVPSAVPPFLLLIMSSTTFELMTRLMTPRFTPETSPVPTGLPCTRGNHPKIFFRSLKPCSLDRSWQFICRRHHLLSIHLWKSMFHFSPPPIRGASTASSVPPDAVHSRRPVSLLTSLYCSRSNWSAVPLPRYTLVCFPPARLTQSRWCPAGMAAALPADTSWSWSPYCVSPDYTCGFNRFILAFVAQVLPTTALIRCAARQIFPATYLECSIHSRPLSVMTPRNCMENVGLMTVSSILILGFVFILVFIATLVAPKIGVVCRRRILVWCPL